LQGQLVENGLLTVVNILGRIARAALEEIVIRLDIGGQIEDFTRFQLPGGIKHDGIA
jgi:hypothetical protein